MAASVAPHGCDHEARGAARIERVLRPLPKRSHAIIRPLSELKCLRFVFFDAMNTS